MTTNAKATFQAELLRPLLSDASQTWAFVILPQEASAILPRRGRTSVEGRINGQSFSALLEPDGQKSHWLQINQDLLDAAQADFGDLANFEISPMENEPEPDVPDDLLAALNQAPEAKKIWESTTTIARLDWIHWVTSAKQAKTRRKRIDDACDMLAQGKKRVCCFDPSGFYSKALSAPRQAD